MIALLAALAAAAAPASIPASAPLPVNVTAYPMVARDVAIAAAYWGEPACGPVTFIVAPLGPSRGNDGIMRPPTPDASATTIPGQCVITIAPTYWAARHWRPVAFCDLIAHEWGHTIGYLDGLTVEMMDQFAVNDRLPACVYGAGR